MNRPLSRKHLLRLPLAISLAAGLASASLSGCGEEPPPPPPPKKDPPPPPPPPPPELSMQALLQEMKADARVTFADSVKITDEALARSVITLADGFARGDASKLRSVLEPSAQGVLGALDASGEWSSATSGIEAVRVVFVGDPGDALRGPDPMDITAVINSEKYRDLFKDLPMDKLAAAAPELRKAIEDKDPEALEKITKDMGIPEGEIPALNLTALNMMEGREDALDGSPRLNFPRVVVLAVQDAKGAFVLGWGTGDSGGRFGTAPTVPTTKPRASDFDSIGLGAFGGEAAKAAEPPAATEGEGTNAEEPAPAPGEEPKTPGGPTRKNTPGGPVTIPGSG